MPTDLEEFWNIASKYDHFKPPIQVQQFLEAQMNGELVEHVDIPSLKNMNNFTYWNMVRSVIGFVSPTLEWAREMKKVIDNKSVLEVGAGTGLVARYLDSVGIKITATDDFSWYDRDKVGSNWKMFFDVERLDFKEAISKYPADYLLLCWPMYDNSLARDAAELFTSLNQDGLIIYIGEGLDGCTADDEFHYGLEIVDELDDVNRVYPQWTGLHDYISIGKWHK